MAPVSQRPPPAAQSVDAGTELPGRRARIGLRMAHLIRVRAVLLIVALALSACGVAVVPPPVDLGGSSEPVVQFPPLDVGAEPARLEQHLEALMAVAEANHGVRTVGTPGYESSVDYVAGQLRDLGWRVETPEEAFTGFRELSGARLEVGDATFTAPDELHALIYSAGGDVTSRIAVMSRSGCEPDDFAGVPDGAIAVTAFGGCLRRQQVSNAQAAGAAAMVLVYHDRGPGQILRPTLLSPAGIDIPAISVTAAAGRALQDANGEEAHLVVEVEREPGTLRNVIAELGDGEQVVMLGAHLDSVIDGPGLNDNGSGVAALLEVARGISEVGVPQGATIRLGFWGGEEFGILGSSAYVDGLTDPERTAISAYLNLDMVGSPNGITFVYADGHARRGSGGITIDYEVWFEGRDLPSARLDLGGASDHRAFAEAGIPTGGIFTGATELKTAEQADVFGGTAGAPTDPCYHLACDTVENVDLERTALNADASLAVALRLAAQASPE